MMHANTINLDDDLLAESETRRFSSPSLVAPATVQTPDSWLAMGL
jgi:hypothetical protein